MQLSSLLTLITSGLLLTSTALAAPALAAVPAPPQPNSVEKRAEGEEMYLCNCYSESNKRWNFETAWYKAPWVPYRFPDDAHPVQTGGVVTWENRFTIRYADGNYLVTDSLNGSFQKGVYAGKIYNKYRWFNCYGAENAPIFYDSRFDSWCGAVYKCI